jgi:hypothetical protein
MHHRHHTATPRNHYHICRPTARNDLRGTASHNDLRGTTGQHHNDYSADALLGAVRGPCGRRLSIAASHVPHPLRAG